MPSRECSTSPLAGLDADVGASPYVPHWVGVLTSRSWSAPPGRLTGSPPSWRTGLGPERDQPRNRDQAASRAGARADKRERE